MSQHSHESHHEHQEHEQLDAIRRELEEIRHLLTRIPRILIDFFSRPTSISIKFQGATTMPLTFAVNQKSIATATEADASGVNVPVVAGALTWTVSDPTIASVVTNPDGTGTYTAVAVGTATATVTDSANGLTTTDTLTVTAAGAPGGTPTSIAISFGAPA
jgi:ABC-type amino acid transport substrate-binding protein